MRTRWITALISVVLTAVCLVLAAGEQPGAREILGRIASLSAVGPDSSGLRDGGLIQRASHETCDVTLKGYCSGRYRSCVRDGKPKAACEAWADRCAVCSAAMSKCRRKVGHEAGATCTNCKAALTKCREENVRPK